MKFFLPLWPDKRFTLTKIFAKKSVSQSIRNAPKRIDRNAKTRSIQRTQTPPHLWHLTLWCDLELSSRSRKLMSLDVAFVLFLGTSYDVYGFNVLRDITIEFCLFHETFDLHLWPSAFVKVTCTFVIRCF